MYLIWLLISIEGSLFADFTGYQQGLGTYKVFPDIVPSYQNIQLGLRNFYNIKGTAMLSIALNKKQLGFSVTYLNLGSYFKFLELGFTIRRKIKEINYGLCITFNREFLPVFKNYIEFSTSTGINLSKALNIHAGVSGLPYHVKLPLILNMNSPAGKTSLLVEGEKYMPLRVSVFQRFLLSPRISFLLFLSTVPYKIGASITLSYGKIKFTGFSEIHDTLGQSGGALVEYAPYKSYN